MKGSIKILIFFLLLTGCDKPSELSKLRITESVRKNKECVRIFKEKYGITHERINSNEYLASLLRDFESKAPKDVLKSYFLRFDNFGETYVSTEYYIYTTNHNTKIFKISNADVTSKITDNLDLENLLKASISDEQINDRLIVISKSDNKECECEFYDNLSQSKFELMF